MLNAMTGWIDTYNALRGGLSPIAENRSKVWAKYIRLVRSFQESSVLILDFPDLGRDDLIKLMDETFEFAHLCVAVAMSDASKTDFSVRLFFPLANTPGQDSFRNSEASVTRFFGLPCTVSSNVLADTDISDVKTITKAWSVVNVPVGYTRLVPDDDECMASKSVKVASIISGNASSQKFGLKTAINFTSNSAHSGKARKPKRLSFGAYSSTFVRAGE